MTNSLKLKLHKAHTVSEGAGVEFRKFLEFVFRKLGLGLALVIVGLVVSGVSFFQGLILKREDS
jgi:hypothetical protein